MSLRRSLQRGAGVTNARHPFRLAAMDSWRSPHGRPLPAIGQRTLIMGVLNITPDSFSDGGQLPTLASVVERARTMLEHGADILDVGGESTRPGAEPVDVETELARVQPAIAALRQTWPKVPLSIDTFKAPVATAAIHAGADIVNDVWGLTHGITADVRQKARELVRSGALADGLPSSAMAEAAARLGCPVIAMHNRPARDYADFWPDVILDLKLSVALAERAGVSPRQLWLDPGFGFAKEPAQNLEVLNHLDRIVALGHPVLVGTSRKSTIGKVLGTTVDDRIEGTGATVVWAIQKGCAMVRVHDVAAMVRFARMADAIKAGIDFKPTGSWTN
jgi:dihydropteroate synthase